MKPKFLNSKFIRLSNGMIMPVWRGGYGREAIANEKPKATLDDIPGPPC
jgi:hypothetical protein